MPRLSVTLLGTFAAQLDQQRITEFEYDKVRALLVYLMVESARPQRRETLAGLLWPELSERIARHNLSQALFALRHVIADRVATPPFLLITRQTLRFNTESDYTLDVATLTACQDSVQHHAHTDLATCSACQARLVETVRLYRGDFLNGFSLPDSPPFEEWSTLHRERLRLQALDALHMLTESALHRDAYAQALDHARDQLELDPWRESAHRQAMLALALRGERSAAVAQYIVCRDILHTGLDVEPGPATVALYERIKAANDLGDVAPRMSLGRGVAFPVPGEPPFKGLDFFGVPDADLFFGREELTSDLVERVRGRSRLLIVVGASGSGKSSLVRAGLAAALQRAGRWRMQILTPTERPLANLAQHLIPNNVTEAAALEAEFARDPGTLRRYARNALAGADGLSLIVDQFEEVFTLCHRSGERRAFIENLLAATEAGSAASVVLTLRADFYQHCARFVGLRRALAQNQVYIGAMTEDELRCAIEAPAAQGEWIFEPGLVDLLLHDVGVAEGHSPEPGALPLLSHALLETWKRRRGRVLTFGGYAEAGGVRGAIASTAESAYQQLAAEQQVIARDVFLRLTELGEGTDDTRRQPTLQEIRSCHIEHTAVDMVLAQLADARLITMDRKTVQVAHEALIREWPTLRAWLEEDRQGLRIHRHMTESAQAWEELDHDPSELYRGARLAQAVEWLTAHPTALNTLEYEFLAASQAEVERVEAEREAQRQHELEAAHQLAASERQRATEHGRLLRWIVLAAVLLLCATIISLALGNQAQKAAHENAMLSDRNAGIAATAVAVSELEAEQRAVAEAARIEADEQRSAAEAAQAAAEAAEHEALVQASVGLAARALDELKGISPERAVLLALAALEEYPYTPQAESALARAVYENWPYVVFDDPGGAQSLARAAWSPDGRYVAVAEQFQPDSAVIWDTATAEVVQRLPWDAERARRCSTFDIAWSPAGDRIVISSLHALSSACNTVWVWDVASGEPLLALSDQELSPWGVDWSPDGSTIIAAYDDGRVLIWDADTGDERLAISVTTSWVGAAVWSPGGERFATASGDGVAHVWDGATGEELRTLSGHSAPLYSLAWSPDGVRLATASRDGTVRVWDTVNGEVVLTLAGHTGEGGGGNPISAMGVLAVAWSPDGTRLATAGSDRTVRIWRADTGAEVFQYYGVAQAWHVAWAPDSRHLAIRGAEQTRILDLSTEPLRLRGQPGNPRDAQWSPDGTRIATGSGIGPNIPRIWDAVTGAELLQLHSPDIVNYSYVAWSPDGTRLISGHPPTRIWDATTGEVLLEIPYPAPEGWFHMVAWSPDGTRIATSNVFEFTVSILDAENGEHIFSFGEPDCFKQADWSPDGTRIATGCYLAESEAAPVRIWDATTGDELLAMDSPGGDTTLVEWSPDGARLASGHTGGTAMVWDATTGAPLLAFAGHDEWVWDVTWSPNGQRIASSDFSGVVKVWDATTGAEVLSFQAPSEAMRLDWSPDGQYLTVAGNFSDPMVQRVWESTADLIGYAYDCCVFRELTPAERSQFKLSVR